jgi:hypothetical protein
MTFNARVETQPDGVLIVVLASPEKVHVATYPSIIRQIRDRYPAYSMGDILLLSHGVIALMRPKAEGPKGKGSGRRK